MPIVHKEATMSREELNQIRYVIAFISEFARKFNLGQKQAFNYLKRFKGLDYLYSFYDVLHTQSFHYLPAQWWKTAKLQTMILYHDTD